MKRNVREVGSSWNAANLLTRKTTGLGRLQSEMRTEYKN
jgi:hypothetical protein